MSLTQDDLKAVKQLVDSSIDERVQPMLNSLEKGLEGRIIMRIDKLDNTLSHQTAVAFAEVHNKIDDLREVVGRIERVQQAELTRNDKQDIVIKQMRKRLHAV